MVLTITYNRLFSMMDSSTVFFCDVLGGTFIASPVEQEYTPLFGGVKDRHSSGVKEPVGPIGKGPCLTIGRDGVFERFLVLVKADR